MIRNVVCDRTGRLSKNITEHIIKIQVGNGQAVMGTVFLASEHIGKYGTVTHQVADSFGILAVSLMPFLGLCIFRMGKCNKTGLFKDVES